MDQNRQVFFALLRAGLWEQSVRLSPFTPIGFDDLFKLADEQSVVGLIAAGLEHVEDMKITKPQALPFLKKVFSTEGRNQSMNAFIEELVRMMREAGIYTLLVKGQGIAQCYERPQWRSAGDIDFFLDHENYEKAKAYLTPISDSHDTEEISSKHYGLRLKSWPIELHGTLRCGLSFKMDLGIDLVQKDIFTKGEVIAWRNGTTDVFLPSPNNDVIFIFTHFLKHFYKGGIGLRQICDWCRLLWTYRKTIDLTLLKERLHSMQLVTEWRAFAAFAVEFLGMPSEAMPLYDNSKKWVRKAGHIQAFILEVGNFGQNRDLSYYNEKPYLIRKVISLKQRIEDITRHAIIFPIHSMKYLPYILFKGIQSAIRGE